MAYFIALIVLIFGLLFIGNSWQDMDILGQRKPVYNTVTVGPFQLRECIKNCE